MREQDVERIAAEVLAALREGAPAGADRPAGRGDTGGAGLVPPAGRGGQPEAAHTGMPTAQDEGRDGDGTLPDLAGPEFRRGCFIASPHRRDVIDDFVSHTGARIATGTVGTRPPTRACLRFLADHARSKGTVFKEVPEEWISGHGLWSVSTLAEDKDTYLTRPDLGRLLSEESLRELKRRYADAPQVVIVLSDGLSTDALLANYEEILPPLLNGLKQAGIRAGAPLFLRHGRVKAEDRIGEAVGCDVVVMLVGERPGLGQSESMSCYAVYRPTADTLESDRSVLSNIHREGTPPVEAAAVIVDLVRDMLHWKASGIKLNRRQAGMPGRERGKPMPNEANTGTRAYVPGKQVTVAHLIAHPAPEVCEKAGIPDVDAIGILTLTPGETAIIAGDMAVRSADVNVAFLDRFSGTLILYGSVGAVEQALTQVNDMLNRLLQFTICPVTRH